MESKWSPNSANTRIDADRLLAPPGGTQTQDYLFDPAKPVGSRVLIPVDLGASTDQVFLSLYGTGFRGATQATATVGGVTVPVAFAAV